MNNKINIINTKEKFEDFCQCKLPIINVVYSIEKDIYFTTVENKSQYNLTISNDTTQDELFYAFGLINDDYMLPNLSIPVYREFRASLIQLEYLLQFKNFKPANFSKYNKFITLEYVSNIKNF